MKNPTTRVNQLLWNSFDLGYFPEEKKPYLTYKIFVESSKLNIPKLSKKQLHLFDKICQFKDEGLTFKQISNKLNELGYRPTRGEKGEFTPQKVWSNYNKIKNNQNRNVEITFLDIVNVNLVYE